MNTAFSIPAQICTPLPDGCGFTPGRIAEIINAPDHQQHHVTWGKSACWLHLGNRDLGGQALVDIVACLKGDGGQWVVSGAWTLHQAMIDWPVGDLTPMEAIIALVRHCGYWISLHDSSSKLFVKTQMALVGNEPQFKIINPRGHAICHSASGRMGPTPGMLDVAVFFAIDHNALQERLRVAYGSPGNASYRIMEKGSVGQDIGFDDPDWMTNDKAYGWPLCRAENGTIEFCKTKDRRMMVEVIFPDLSSEILSCPITSDLRSPISVDVAWEAGQIALLINHVAVVRRPRNQS